MSISSGIGINIIEKKLIWYFNEAQGRYLITCSKQAKNTLTNLMNEHEIKYAIIGNVGGKLFSLGKEKITVKEGLLRSKNNRDNVVLERWQKLAGIKK